MDEVSDVLQKCWFGGLWTPTCEFTFKLAYIKKSSYQAEHSLNAVLKALSYYEPSHSLWFTSFLFAIPWAKDR